MEWEDLIRSKSFLGALIVGFDDSIVVRTDKSLVLTSLAGKEDLLIPVRQILTDHPSAIISRLKDIPEVIVDERRKDLERISGRAMPDWNSVYRIDIDDPETAIDLLKKMRQVEGVRYVHPAIRQYPAGLSTTPSLTGWQAYLLPESSHGGLNAQAAWSRGVRGEGIDVVDEEHGLNYDHEDLGLSSLHISMGGNNLLDWVDCVPPNELVPDCASWRAHGTAVAGILAAKDNNHGVTGFAPLARVVTAPAGLGALDNATDGYDDAFELNDDDIEPGSVWLKEVQGPGKFSSGTCGSTPETSYGCIPEEVWPSHFDSIVQATAYGVTVVSGGGNGSISLDDPNLYTGDWSFAKNLSLEDAGAIMVGASRGSDKNKADFSNCGSRFNAFAWGQGVVTTGMPYGQYAWNGTTPPVPNDQSNPNNFYIDNFGGTSSAAAMVAGAVALVQSHARASLGHRRYIMPLKMREIVTTTGVSQVGAGCNIGRQPRVDQAMNSVDTFIAQARASYPELDSGEMLTTARYVSMRAMGVGIICKKWDPVGSDPICPDSEIFPPGEGIGKDLDFDADGRADLVQWTNGTWKLDLSSRGPGGDNYGEWDIEIAHAPLPGRWVWPYVIDMNSDGRTDFVVYDKENGKFYVKFTDTALLRNGTWGGWDWVIDYSAEWKDDLKLNPLACTTGTGPNCSNYSRPVLGDYNRDGWNDIAIACSDGIWRIDLGGQNETDFGAFERNIQYLDSEKLGVAPGWAYLATTIRRDRGPPNPIVTYISYKEPDDTPDAGRVHIFNPDYMAPEDDWNKDKPAIYGGNDIIPIMAFLGSGALIEDTGLLYPDGRWLSSNFSRDAIIDVDPSSVYGGAGCRPVAADFDGDGVADRTVMCDDEWRIAYSEADTFALQREADGSRRIALEYGVPQFTLPGRPYAGGASYAWVKQFIEDYQDLHPGTPPPIHVDMATAY